MQTRSVYTGELAKYTLRFSTSIFGRAQPTAWLMEFTNLTRLKAT